MKIRIAKKIFRDPDRYTGQQRYSAAHRMYRFASTFKDGEVGLMALILKPQRSFHDDDQLDLRFETFTAQVLRGEQPTFGRGEVVIPQENIRKPVFRRDGQVQNFGAPAYPNTFYTGGQDSGIDKGWWEMGEHRYDRPYSRKKYQIRTGGKDAGIKPKRLRRSAFGFEPLRQRIHVRAYA